MNEKGIAAYKLYYLMDFIFGVPIFRGICDIIENAILLWTLHTYPVINEMAISISAKFTMAKLMSIKVWILLVVIGLVWKLILYLKR